MIFRHSWYRFPSITPFASPSRLMVPKMDILSESPETKVTIISAHGMLPVLEVLENCTKREVILKLLKIMNAVCLPG